MDCAQHITKWRAKFYNWKRDTSSDNLLNYHQPAPVNILASELHISKGILIGLVFEASVNIGPSGMIVEASARSKEIDSKTPRRGSPSAREHQAILETTCQGTLS